MEEFFKSVKFKILVTLFVVAFGMMVRSAKEGTTSNFISKTLAFVTEPFAKTATIITSNTGDFFGGFVRSKELQKENEQLKKDVAQLTTNLVEFEKYKNENNKLKEFLDIKERNLDFDFEPAMVVGRDTGDRFFSFTIDKGSIDGISVNDPVICGSGLVGRVSEVGSTHSKVVTILDATVDIGVMDTATREIGVVSGNIAMSLEGKTKFSYLPRDSSASVGDIVVTSGVGGIFPKDLVVGSISAIIPENSGLSIYAEITPLEDVRTIRDVLIIKHFNGQASTRENMN